MPRTSYAPADASGLLSDRKLIAFACNVIANEAFAKADARTRDAFGRRVADYVRTQADRDAWPLRVETLLRLPPAELHAALEHEPVKLSAIDKPNGGTRVVGVPTFARRCVSNVLRAVLSLTGDPLLPLSVRAYRPDSRDSVKNALLDVADAVGKGRVRYWAKLDFTSYFSIMPWSGIEAALRHYGYEADFVGTVMAVVRCPLVAVNKKGQTVPHPNARGAQMGLAESPSLANMLPFALDAHFTQLARSVYYLRYSDDVFIGGRSRSDVVGGVRAVQRWCRTYGIAIKGVSPDMNAQKLVHDIKNTPIDLLGAEVDMNGEVRLPIAKLREKLGEIRCRYESVVQDGAVHGVSRYGDGGGTHLFDVEDVAQTVQGFLSYWDGLDPRGMRRAATLIRKLFPMPASPRSGGQGVVWMARLWDLQADGGVEVATPAVHEPSRPTDAFHLALAGAGEVSGLRRVRSTMGNATSERESGPEPASDEKPAEAGSLYTDAEAELQAQGEVDDSDEESSAYDAGDDDALCDAEDRKISSFSFTSMDDGGISIVRRDLSDITGAVNDPPEEPPLPAVLENVMVIHVMTRRLPQSGRRRRSPRCAVGVAITIAGALVSAPSVVIRLGRREAAAVRAMLSFVSEGTRQLVFALEEPWLPKVLLQPHRRLRAPTLFSAVLDLHREARHRRVDVVIAGNVIAPQALGDAVAAAVAADVAASAA